MTKQEEFEYLLHLHIIVLLNMYMHDEFTISITG